MVYFDAIMTFLIVCVELNAHVPVQTKIYFKLKSSKQA